MRGLAYFRIGLGALAWLAPRAMNRIFGVPRADDSPALVYMNRVFGVRAVTLGVGYLALQALAITGGATAVDLAAMRSDSSTPP